MAQSSLPISSFSTRSSTAAAPSRPAAFLCALACGALLSACGGDPDSKPPDDGTDGITYTVGGTLSGLAAGQTLTLVNGSDTLTLDTTGSFVFATPLASRASYLVQVSGAQPAWQSCSVSNGQGRIAGAPVSNVAVTCVSTDNAPTGRLNDTGINACAENITAPVTWINDAVCSTINWVGNLWGEQQDAYVGRDAQARAGTLVKVGSGMAGFDFTRISASGQELARQDGTWSDSGSEEAGTLWDCVRDNVTGLVWENKRNDPTHLRHARHVYTWYNPDSTTNGGNAGSETGTNCPGVADETKCNTQSYVSAVNAAGLCGRQDWRLPTQEELLTLVHHGLSNPSIDTAHFPHTTGDYWSSSSVAYESVSAWHVFFSEGYVLHNPKNFAYRVRLVRSGQ
jgi:hypothetical protein